MPATKKSQPAKSKKTPEADTSAEDAPIAARPALRADTSGQGRTLDALGNPRD
jgi:hypothetical protein